MLNFPYPRWAIAHGEFLLPANYRIFLRHIRFISKEDGVAKHLHIDDKRYKRMGIWDIVGDPPLRGFLA